jgi:hypothetical protein
MNVDPHQSWALYAVSDPVEDDDFTAVSIETAPDVFKSGWLAGGLQDRLAA